jgi:RNA polymerase sigma factor (sigma-70 family)
MRSGFNASGAYGEQPPPSDAEEIAASISEAQRFGVIAERHFAEIYRFLSQRIGAEGEDLASETFVVAFRCRSSYDTTRPDCRPWLYGIAVNLIRRKFRSEVRKLGAYKREAAQIASANAGQPDDTTRVADRIDAASELARISEAFYQLDDNHRDALYLVGVAGLTYKEAAETLGLSLGTLHSRVARARSALRDLLDASAPHGHPSVFGNSAER